MNVIYDTSGETIVLTRVQIVKKKKKTYDRLKVPNLTSNHILVARERIDKGVFV